MHISFKVSCKNQNKIKAWAGNPSTNFISLGLFAPAQRRCLSYLVCRLLDGDPGFVSELLGKPVALKDLHPYSLVFLDEFFELGLYVFLLHLEGTLGFSELFQAAYQLVLLVEDAVFLL